MPYVDVQHEYRSPVGGKLFDGGVLGVELEVEAGCGGVAGQVEQSHLLPQTLRDAVMAGTARKRLQVHQQLVCL